jgi:hypothetical protein
MANGLEDLRPNRDPSTTVRERHHVGDARVPSKYKHVILLVLYRR